MRVAIIGNGLSGTIFAKTLRELNPGAEITLFGEEKHLYYPRPNLIEYMAGNLPEERLFPFKPEWYRDLDLQLHLDCTVVRIERDSRVVFTSDGDRYPYDRLLLATGAYASIPPFQGADKPGVFAVRTLDDVREILAYKQNHPRVAVIGGGLLGLEIARAMKARGAGVTVYEFFPILLPRQLDAPAAEVLKTIIEDIGIAVHLGVTTEEITGRDEAQGLRFKDGAKHTADMVIVAAGVRPRLELAQAAGLEVDRGIKVNDQLQTSDPAIYAAGDSTQHQDRVYGIIPASFQQARTAAVNVGGSPQIYEGTVSSNTLKVVGVDVTSIGLVNPEPGAAREYRKRDPERGLYKKIVVQEGKLVGAIWMGTKQGVSEISRLVSQNADVSRWRGELLDDGFDLSEL
jgi:nitrite reductase (NADH) large subunit